MPVFELKPASEFPILQLADLLTRGFEGYFVPININDAVLLTMMRRDGIDLTASRVIIKDDESIGVALIARRGWSSRLAAMGIISSGRNSGAGTFAMERLVEDARGRNDKQMFLEVIEQNAPGVKLYKRTGFKSMRRLVGYQAVKPRVESGAELKEIDIRELARLIAIHGMKDLPWQLSSETISCHTPPSRAFCLDDAYCLIGNPDGEHVVLSSVLVKADSRRAGRGQRMMRAAFSRFPNKTWHVPAIYPEELSPFFEEAGMQPEEISQLQMSMAL